MYKYTKLLVYPLKMIKGNVKMAKYIITGLGGASGELSAAIRYFSQKYTMPDAMGRNLLNDIATEELGHVEMISTIVYTLLKNASLEELKKEGLESYYIEHNKGVFPINAEGASFTTNYISISGNPIVDLTEDLAAEEKARATYENLIDICEDENLRNILLFLREREIIHYNRFRELLNIYKNKYQA